MKTLRVVAFCLLLSCFLQTSAYAVQEKQASQSPTGLSLEITYFKGRPPAYQPVPQGAWYGFFGKISAWTPPKGFLPVQAVNICSRVEGESVRVIVSVHVGRKQFEREDPVSSFLLRENEKVAVDELTAFGVEPFEVALIRVAPRSVPLPPVTSSAPSVQVVNVQVVEGTFPAYRLTLLNSSDKNINALYIETYVGGTLRLSRMPQNRDGSVLITAGENYELKQQMNNVARPAGGGFLPETPTNQSVFIRTAVFEDGTFEGDPAPALEYRSFSLGRRIQVERLTALFQTALESTEPNAGLILDALRQQVGELGTDPPPEALSKLLAEFSSPTADRRKDVRDIVEMVMFEIRKEALKSIDDFKLRQSGSLALPALKVWLTSSKDNYQRRLDRLAKL